MNLSSCLRNPARKERSKLTAEEWNRYFTGHWNFRGERQDKHLAMFPVELPTRLIKMFSFAGDTVLDPFAGSGTTSLAAMNLDRNSIGYEINSKFVDIIREKLAVKQSNLWNPRVEFVHDHAGAAADWRAMFAGLPYIFRDPVQMERKVDPKKMQFGSKLDANSPRRVMKRKPKTPNPSVSLESI